MDWPRRVFAGGAVAMALVAFAGSLAHTHRTIVEYGQAGWVAVATALAPEASVALSVLRIRHGGDPRQVRWAWLVLVTNAGFTLWGNLEQAKGIDLMPEAAGALIVSGWLAWSAIGAAGLIEFRERQAVKVRATSKAPASATVAPVASAAGAGSGAVVARPVAQVAPAGATSGGVGSGVVASEVGAPGGAVAKHRGAGAGRGGTARAAAMADAERLAVARGGVEVLLDEDVWPEIRAELVGPLKHAKRTVDRAVADLRAGLRAAA